MHPQARSWAERLRSVLIKSAYPLLRWKEDGEETIVSGAALWCLALERRHRWRQLGLRPGDIVLSSPVGISFVIDLVACAIGGQVLWPKPSQTELGGDQSEDHFAGPSATKTFDSSSNDFVRNYPRGQPAHSRDDFPAFYLQTSGTSGPHARTIALSHDAVIYQLDAHLEQLAPRQSETRICSLPWNHAFGLILDLLLGICARQDIVLLRTKEITQPTLALYRALIDERPEWIAAVPRQLDGILSLGVSMPKLTIHVGGGVLGLRSRELSESRFGRLVEGYGLTECSPGVLLDGLPLPGTRVRLSPAGELEVASPSLGTWENRENFVDSDGFLRTGDIAREDSTGRFSILGRAGDRIKTRDGAWITRNGLEHDLERVLNVPAVCFLMTTEGPRLVLFVRPEEPEAESKSRSALRYLAKRLCGDARVSTKILSPELQMQIQASPKKTLEDALFSAI